MIDNYVVSLVEQFRIDIPNVICSMQCHLIPIRSFSADRVSVRRDRSKSNVVRILFCAAVKPHENHINIIKHHKVFVHYISSVLKLFHSLIRGTDEYLSC